MSNIITIDYLRSFRFGTQNEGEFKNGFAIFDFIISFITMGLIGLYFKKTRQFLAATLPLSIISHLAVGRITPLTKMTIGPGYYSVKLIMIILTGLIFI
jgi:hypothetical protein